MHPPSFPHKRARLCSALLCSARLGPARLRPPLRFHEIECITLRCRGFICHDGSRWIPFFAIALDRDVERKKGKMLDDAGSGRKGGGRRKGGRVRDWNDWKFVLFFLLACFFFFFFIGFLDVVFSFIVLFLFGLVVNDHDGLLKFS